MKAGVFRGLLETMTCNEKGKACGWKEVVEEGWGMCLAFGVICRGKAVSRMRAYNYSMDMGRSKIGF